ncbi:helix-turn-helix transcriptional regulator [Escherichia coli]|uniref:helix-turn-helix transcriptional regulator n=2 Tax=Escherichia coli TaxID=562 RepID=UPI0015DC889E|nr:AraC family transcriptional regulator [Escherichia coli]BBR01921.1 hypothetical protein WP3W18E08_41990 [Escherichia coli]
MLDNVCDYIVQWVEDNLDTGKNINDLIEDIGYSRKTVEVWFLNKYGVNIGEYLFKRRMSRASVLLKLTHLTITEIATLLHYSSSQNFARTFKRFSNKSPTEYRNSEAWDVTTLQHSFLYEFDIKNATRSTISSIFFHGVSYKINESFLYRNKTQDKKSLQYLIKNLLNEKKHDILVCISEFNSIDLDKSRKGIVNTLIKAGEVLNKTQEAVAVMPGGGVLSLRFSWGVARISLIYFFFLHCCSKRRKIHYQE